MIDTQRKEERERKKDKTRKRMHVEIDPENYEYTPAKKAIDYYDNDTPQRVEFTSVFQPMMSDKPPLLNCKNNIMRNSSRSIQIGRSLKYTPMKV